MAPTITVTEIAQNMFSNALAEEEAGSGIRLAVQKLDLVNMHYELELVEASHKHEDDIQIDVGQICFWIDPDSAALVDGTVIDYLEVNGTAGFKFKNPNDLRHKKWEDPIAHKFQQLLDNEINPSIAAHQGYIVLVNYHDCIAEVYMGGGCQGCGQAALTLREGVETKVKAAIPEIRSILDATDHASGSNPFY